MIISKIVYGKSEAMNSSFRKDKIDVNAQILSLIISFLINKIEKENNTSRKGTPKESNALSKSRHNIIDHVLTPSHTKC